MKINKLTRVDVPAILVSKHIVSTDYRFGAVTRQDEGL
jgi:hypothetical protein